jgi:hypothetical protein
MSRGEGTVKTITQFVREGIDNCSELQDALQTAMRLEFSTIPPYLCAEWSINVDNDLDGVRTKIHGVVVQEMYHFALAGNMLSAIGGMPKIANPGFLPNYPTHKLPGDIYQDLAVDLQPLSKEQLEVFIQIEKPEFPPVEIAALRAAAPATIGEFYSTLSDAFRTLGPKIDLEACWSKGASLDIAIDDMKKLRKEGRNLISQGIRPEFGWAA